MGLIIHNVMIVTSWDKKQIKKAHKAARSIIDGDGWKIVSDIHVSPLNGYSSFCVFPDGSQEGWSDSDIGDQKREALRLWAKENAQYIELVEVEYGDYKPRIVEAST